MKTSSMILSAAFALILLPVEAQQTVTTELPCPAGAVLCKKLVLVTDPTDLTHFQILLSVDVKKIEDTVRPAAQSAINSNLPQAVKQEVQIGSVKNINARVFVDQLRIGPYGPPSMIGPIHPPAYPPHLHGVLGPIRPAPGDIPLSISGRVQKDELDYEYHPFPLPGHGGWADKGWRDCATFTAPGTVSLSSSSAAPIYQQEINLATHVTSARFLMTACFFMGSVYTASLNVNYATVMPVIDETTAAANGLHDFAILSVTPVSITSDASGETGIFQLKVGPVPPVGPRRKSH